MAQDGLESLGSILSRTTTSSQPSKPDAWDWSEWEKKRLGFFNGAESEKFTFECEKCKGRGGFLALDKDGNQRFRNCSCKAIRDTRAKMRNSGLSDAVLDDAKFDRWETPDAWQKIALEKAERYVECATENNTFGEWFIMSGRPGSGKTKLCSTVFRAILETGKRGKYVSWREFAREAKSLTNDKDSYRKIVDQVKQTDLLYIDDFWKGGRVTEADISLSFEIINDRYISGKLTILSSEFTLEGILKGDEAIGSRMAEKAANYYIDTTKARNWRISKHG